MKRVKNRAKKKAASLTINVGALGTLIGMILSNDDQIVDCREWAKIHKLAKRVITPPWPQSEEAND
jgi:hypothetical protein